MREPANPFAAPQHDSPPPVDSSGPSRLLPAIAVVEIITGVGFGLLSALGAFYSYRSPEPYNLQRFVLVEAITLSLTVVCIAAGVTLRRRLGNWTRYLQLVPALLVVALLVKLALAAT